MGSMGMLLADWSIELIKSRRKKSKLKKDKKEKKVNDVDEQGVCGSCHAKHLEIAEQKDQLHNFAQERDRAKARVLALHNEQRAHSDNSEQGELEQEESPSGHTLDQTIDLLVNDAKEARESLARARHDCTRLAEGVGAQLAERDRAHAERVASLEMLMAEKEAQLLGTANALRQQLSTAQHDLRQMEDRHARLQQQQQQQLRAKTSIGSSVSSGSSSGCSSLSSSLEQEVESLRLVLEMRRVEVEQLRASNNALLLEMERCRAMELHSQAQGQQIEEMEAVLHNKNLQIRKLYDDQDRLTQQLEIEESAHLQCQQELEQSQWAMENFISSNREKVNKNLENLKESGLILDLVHKDKSIAYSINC